MPALFGAEEGLAIRRGYQPRKRLSWRVGRGAFVANLMRVYSGRRSPMPTHPTRRVTLTLLHASTVITLAVTLLLPRPGSAQTQDLPESQDHATVSRYAGSIIIGYDFRKFDDYVLPLGPVFGSGSLYTAKKSQKLEGRLTRILYLAPVERSTLEVFRNYEQELKKGGFQVLFTCATVSCGQQPDGMRHMLFPMGTEQQLKGHDLMRVWTMVQDQRYVAAKRSSPQGDTYASLYIARDANPGVPATNNRTLVLLEIVETAPMDAGLVTVDAAAMAKEIAREGHVALYGIHFDTNKAEIKPESSAALVEIGKLLKADPALKLLVVGHTDSVGGYDPNMALSDRRAAAVLQELTTKHGVAAARLRAVGVGMASPVASNDTDEGRAKNRRVELVKQ
jgi:outer membrane protein OmpA-like peptidoglycan-associated protein